MKIGLSTSVIQQGRTGVGRYVIGLVHALLPMAAKHRFTLFVLENDMPLFAFARDAMEIVRVPERYRSPVADISWHQLQLPRLARQAGLDVLHVPSYRRMVWRAPCTLVATIHDLAPFRVPEKYDWRRMVYGRWVARALALRQQEIIAVSENTAADLRNYFNLPGNRVTVVPNGIDHDRFRPAAGTPDRDRISEKFGVTGPYFLYVARLEHPGKNHVRLIEAFDRFRQLHPQPTQLVFVGSDWTGADAIHRARRHALHAADIHSLGFVPDAELPSLYRAATATLCPSLYEGFGLPLIEAMACGCPVATSPAGSLAEIAGDAALLVPPDDVNAWTQTLLALAKDTLLRERLRVAGILRAGEFSWERTASATLCVYRRALQRTRFPAPTHLVAHPAA